eukprot:CAMPEP_0172179962 /NCGR_PEP_ID=MMETSP1050-20130122/16926_1 /TAXON_ID=233186 /ORGANISM="Cryptomonas curvata, Strain CCAP979/52" /LENGTH=398 /DNA_ID=CAMNT_0012852937 /DNA_START=120 /DNA_END=1312 /DNA_ORIENTATION=+
MIFSRSCSGLSLAATLLAFLFVGASCEVLLSLRLRGGFSRTLASTAISKEVPRAHHFSRKLSGGEDPGPSEEGAASVKALANERHEYGEDEEEQEEEDYAYEEQNVQIEPCLNVQYDRKFMHKVDPWERAAVNLDGFESATKGRNVKLGSTIAISFPIPVAFSTPVPLPFSRPFSRVKLVSEKGSWLNKLLRSPTAPRPQMFGGRKIDPIEYIHRRPFLVIPLAPSGPQSQPHPLSRPVDTSDCRGGVAQTSRSLRVETGDVLNYFEARVGGNAEYSCIGIVSGEKPGAESNLYDYSAFPTSNSAVYVSTGAIMWALDTQGAVSEKEQCLMSAPADPARAFRRGDRVGVLIDLAAGKLAFFKNGKCTAVRSHVPSSAPVRFFVGCLHDGCTWTMVPRG